MRQCPVCAKRFDADAKLCPEDGAVLLIDAGADGLVGKVLRDSYRIERLIGRGGMGTVYRGVQLALGRSVAIKTIRPDLRNGTFGVQRFLREAKALSHVNHPNVVQVHDAGNTEDGVFYLVMELLEGQTLREDVPSDQGLPLHRVLTLFEGICRGVAAIHRAGLVHRDLKPANVICVRDKTGRETAKVLDFGLVRLIDPDPAESQGRVTQSGVLLGSPGYAAPEQITHESPVDARTDIYALGAMLRFMLTGCDAYRGTSAANVMLQQVAGPPEALTSIPGLDAEGMQRLDAEIARAMDKHEHRHADVDELRRAVHAILGPVVELEVGSSESSAARSRVSYSGPALSRPATARDSRRAWLWSGLGVLGVGIAALVTSRPWSSPPAPVAPAAVVPPVAAPRPVVRLGLSAAFTGPSEELGRSIHAGLTARLTEANLRRELDYDVELIHLDDGYEPERAVANMHALRDKKVVAVVGNVGTPTAAKTVPLANRLKLPMIGAFTGASLLRKAPPDRYVFNYRAGYRRETAAIVRYYLERKEYEPHQIAIFAQDDAYGKAGIEGVERSLRAAGHRHHPLVTTYERNTADVDAAVQKLARLRRKIRAVIMISSYRAAALLVKELRDRKFRGEFASVSFVGADALANELHLVGVESNESILVTQVVPPPDSSSTGVVRYRELMAKHVPDHATGFVSLEGFIVGDLAVRALSVCPHPVDPECLVGALEDMRVVETSFGAPWSFGPSDHDASEQIWGTMVHAGGGYEEIDLE